MRESAAEHASQWSAIRSVASTIGRTGETPRNRVRQAERDAGERDGLTSEERERLKKLERKVLELRRGEEDQETVRWTVSPTSEILRKASACFAQAELDRRSQT